MRIVKNRSFRRGRVGLVSIRPQVNANTTEYGFDYFDKDEKEIRSFAIDVDNSDEIKEMKILIHFPKGALPFEVLQEAVKLARENERVVSRIDSQRKYESKK